jgi:hypothetical protein
MGLDVSENRATTMVLRILKAETAMIEKTRGLLQATRTIMKLTLSWDRNNRTLFEEDLLVRTSFQAKPSVRECLDLSPLQNNLIPVPLLKLKSHQ